MRERSFYFSDGQYLQLMQNLCHDLTKPEAFVQLMGSSRSGKSALCETLSLFLMRKGHDVVYIDYPIESPEMLRSVLAKKFNLPSINNVARQLGDTFLPSFEKPKLLIFDDAHQLSDITLLEIHRMAEIQTGSKRVLNVLLCGEPELDERLLNKKELKSLLLNVSRKYLLKPMDKATLSQFFSSYIAKTSSAGLQLSDDALDLLYRSSKGYPGPATLLVELMAQSNAGNTDHRVITKLELAEQIKNSDIQQALPSAELFNVSQLKVLGPIAAVFTIAAIGFMFQIINGDDSDAPASQAALGSIESGSPFSSASGHEIETTDNIVTESGSEVVALSTGQTTGVTTAEASVGTASNSALEPAQNVQLVNRESVPVQPIPSLLRPASVFSLADEDYEEPISDSSLALVTAAEIGLVTDAIVEPEFEDFDSGARVVSDTSAASDTNVENPEQEQLPLVTRSAEADLPLDTPILVDAEVSDNLLVPDRTVVAEVAVETEAVEQSGEPQDAQAEQLAQEALLASDTPEINAVADVAEITVAESTDTIDVETQNLSVAETQPVQNVSAQVRVRALVDSWVSAWEQQRLEGYFSSYSPEFEPRYESNVARWRTNRTRVIGNAEWILLTLNEYEVIDESANAIEVHFWLDYESSTYSDSTKKKLVLGNDSGDWMILEEINLQVRS